MIKALSWRFCKYLERFHMLTVKACSETALFSEWSKQVLHILWFLKYISYDDHHLFPNVENLMYIPEMEQKIEKMFFYFSDSCIWIGSGRFSQCRTKYLPSIVNVLTLAPKIHQTLGETFSSMFSYFSDSWIWIGSGRFSQCQAKYFPSVVNVLTIAPMISPNARGDIFRIKFNENDEKTW